VPAPRSLARAPFLAPARAPQPATKVKPGSPIQVTGGEFQPAEALPAPAPPPPRPVEPAGPGLPKANAALPPAPAGATSDEPVPEAAAKPRSTGNRLAKALGKMNPFRKRAKHPGDETPPTPPGKN